MRILRHLTANDVRLEPFPFKRELSMEAYLIENESVLALDDEIFTNVEIVDAEMPLKEGRKGKDTDGRIDILATYSQEYVAVIELKLGELGTEHLEQLEDYLLQREQVLQRNPEILAAEPGAATKWIGVLIGASVQSDLAQRIAQGYVTSEGIPIAALAVQRFRGSDGSVLVTTDSYFKHPNSKDTTLYGFDGNHWGKGRLVLAVVKHYVQRNPEATFADLEKAFPKDCQGSSGVFVTAEEANQIYVRGGRKRHFVDAKDLVALDDAVVAVSNQWGVGNIDRFRARANELGYHSSPVDG
ncbi:hypothetical protein Pla123a_12720 [Posidoniimonas polymericola]|uniref:Endonuclease NucS n=1 Tax=Posidoniimonas polymericola TaxID=2528002 RepID=A0A5C5YUG9_9BACT|nr:hypothetical protein [Posidoniimonas polymericola]TWT78480.1 hypothetical protein Pla123a_12720 [Posidoniimonas polymericola]